ncbi:MAG: hypothetical protein KKA32_04535 [Actinobacteria bacterium]|nr:hypothetical protein [Actinomycetota bacterium]
MNPWDEPLAPTDRCGMCQAILDSNGTLVETDDQALVMVCANCLAELEIEGSDEVEEVDDHAQPVAPPSVATPAFVASHPEEPAQDTPDPPTSDAGEEAADPDDVGSAFDQPAGPDDTDPAEAARAILLDLATARSQEQSRLDELATQLERLFVGYDTAQLTMMDMENRIRALEADLERTRGRLRRAEGLLGSTGEHPVVVLDAAQSEVATPRSPDHSSTIVVAASDLTRDDIRLIQRFFNESMFISKMRSVRRSLGRPLVNLVKIAGAERKVLLTVGWDIVWYQYLIDLSEDAEGDRITQFGEGMELTELSDVFKETNAIIEDSGRLDASELELSLEQDHPANVVPTAAEEQEAEDATQEIWNKTHTPQFRWDD